MTILSLADVVCDSSCQMGKDREAIGAAFAERDSGTLGESREKHAMAEARQVNKPDWVEGYRQRELEKKQQSKGK